MLNSELPASPRYQLTQDDTAVLSFLVQYVAALEITLRVLPMEDPSYPEVLEDYAHARLDLWKFLAQPIG